MIYYDRPRKRIQVAKKGKLHKYGHCIKKLEKNLMFNDNKVAE